MSSLRDILDGLADQIQQALASTVDDLQVEPRLVFNPTPPCIDLFPGDPFLDHSAMGIASREASITVRARVAGDHQAEQDWLIDMMDRNSSQSVIAAIGNELAVNGDTFQVSVNGPSGFRQYTEPGGNSLLGTEWTVVVPL
jgi:hypothetical protein